jgi:hypothetical protein
MILTLADISHLKELKAAGEHGRTLRAFNTRLVPRSLGEVWLRGGALNGPGAGPISDHEAGRRRHLRQHRMTLPSKLRSH